MEIKGTKYEYLIEPNGYGRVVAYLYKIIETESISGGVPIGTHIHVASKTFGRRYLGLREVDYKEAKNWAELQIRYIYFANK